MTDTRTLDLERLAERYADTHAALSELMAALEAELRAVKRAYLTRIKAVAGRAGTRKQALVEYVQAYPGQFESPRMRTLHGVKVGLQKGRGKLACANADFTIRAIERRHPDKIDVLLKTTRKPVLAGLQQLEARELQVLGVEIVGTGDRIVVRHVDSDIEKMVDAYLEEDEAPLKATV